MSTLGIGIPLQRSKSGTNLSKPPVPPVAGSKVAGLSVAKKSSGISVVKLKPVVAALSPLETMSGLAEFLGNDEMDRRKSITSLLADLAADPTAEKARLAAHDLTIICLKCGLASTEGERVVQYILSEITAAAAGGKGGVKDAGSGGLFLLQTLMTKQHLVRAVEPFIVPMFGNLLRLAGDKSQAVRDGSSAATLVLMRNCSPFCFRVVFPEIVKGMVTEDWKVKVAALAALKELSPRVSRQLTPFLPKLIPLCTECIIDTKPEVKAIGIEALMEACAVITNDDIRHLVPQLITVIARPEESVQTIELLLETTFVQNVDSATLALIAPLLGKLLRGRVSGLKRKAAKVIDSMVRLVQEPQDVAPFVPMLLPYLDRAIDEVTDAEVVEVCQTARKVLLDAMGEGAVAVNNVKQDKAMKRADSNDTLKKNSEAQKVIDGEGPPSPVGVQPQDVKMGILVALKENVPDMEASAQVEIIMNYIATLAAQLVAFHTSPNTFAQPTDAAWRTALAMSPFADWKDCVSPYVPSLFCDKGAAMLALMSGEQKGNDEASSKAEGEDELGDELAAAVLDAADDFSMTIRVAALAGVADLQKEEDDEGGNLCNIEFSLAFGGKILLQNTKLRLGKGRRYGLMGKNGAGKTTLLTNIGNGAIEGLPADLKTVYVQHDDASEDLGVSMIDEMLAGPDMVQCNVTRAEAESALYGIKFTEEMLTAPRSALSGGWKMKLLIVKAMLAKADVLLLDEPTNHLDKASVTWLETYISSQEDLTCLIVSHDTKFLDNVITDVIHYEQKKLVYYHGNLTEFVAIHPEARFYYELDSSTLSFKFPVPEKLDGINSSTKSVMYAREVNFTYPGAPKPQLTDVNVKVVLSSRVAVIGANGAGKSTLIKMLVKETVPDCGEIWNHMNLRVAYVAQHSFHHVELHVEKSPVDYMKWRFGGGVDKESLMKGGVALAEDEIKNNYTDLKYGEVTDVLSRRKNGKNIEYECKFFGQCKKDPNKYFTLDQMNEMGHGKLVEQMDIKVAAMAAGLDVRPVLQAEIQGHLDDFCLEAEYGTHSVIRRLSGGQKVKLVLAAAMWNKPHLLVLDEPTNYLDREALGALTQAIKDFGGGVLIISHNSEFTDALCTEKWVVEDGVVKVEGEAQETGLKGVNKDNKIRKSKSATALSNQAAEQANGLGAGCTNKDVISTEMIMNPKKLEPLTQKEEKKLSRLAAVAGKSLKEYILGITKTSPEWKWL